MSQEKTLKLISQMEILVTDNKTVLTSFVVTVEQKFIDIEGHTK